MLYYSYLQSKFKHLKSAKDYEVLERGKCPATERPDRVIKAKAFGTIWERQILAEDWGRDCWPQ